MNQKNLYSILIFGGVLPFLLVAIAPYLGIRSLPILGNIKTVGALYTLVIISFMAGVHWGICINKNNKMAQSQTFALMLGSNIYVIVPWLCYIAIGSSLSFYLCVIVGFVLLLVSDHSLYRQSIISEHYYRTRRLVTLLVVICLVLTWFGYLV